MLVIIPTHNEHGSLRALIDELRRLAPDAELLVVDDGSHDGTGEILPRLGVRWLRLAVCLGVGSAMRAGLRWAHEHGHTLVVRVDGDGQHAASSLAELVAPLVSGEADAVQGSRYLGPPSYQAPPARRLVQRALAACLSRLVQTEVTDPTSGFWAFGPRAIPLLAASHPTGYAEPELRLLLHRQRLRVREAPVLMRDRTAGRSTLTPGRALVALLRMLLAMVVVPLRRADPRRA